jgi:hypothetical protein
MTRTDFGLGDDGELPAARSIRRLPDRKERRRPSIQSEESRYSDVYNFQSIAPQKLGEDMMWIVGKYNQQIGYR